MKILFLTFIAVFLFVSSPFAEPMQPDSAAAVSGRDDGDLAAASRRIALLTPEAKLHQELEVPLPELFGDEREDLADESELRLPEEELPDSDIPLALNTKVEYMIHFFQGPGKKAFAKWLSRSERYIPMMQEVLRKEGLPEDLVYLAMIESGFSPHAYSVASAVGPWQFISGTGKRYSLRIDEWIDERRDPLKSTVAAALYLKELYTLFNNDWYLAAAGYNAGENKIMRAISMYNTRDFWQISQGSYLKRETKDYVPKLLAAAIIAKDPARYGFADVAYLPAIEFDTVTIPSRTDLQLTAKLCNVTYETIRELNPELRRWCTPPNYPNYQLKIPKGKKKLFEEAYARIPDNEHYVERVVYAKYRAKRRDTLASLAKRYGTTVDRLADLNGLRRTSRIAGRTLRIAMPTPAPAAPSAPAVESATPAPAAPVAPAAETAAVASAKKAIFNKYYTVRRGDTVTSVARRFKIPEKILLAWNNLRHRVALRPGKKIIVARYVEKNGAMVRDNG